MRWIGSILILILASCSVSHVDRYPGSPMTQFPAPLIGEYKLHPGGLRGLFVGKQLDSARIRVGADRIQTLTAEGWTDEFVIGPDKVLSQLGKYYFLSTRDVAEPQFWNCSVLWGNDKQVWVASINATDHNLLNDKLRQYLDLHLIVRSNGTSSDKVIGKKDKTLLKVASTIPADSPDSVLYYHMNDSAMALFVKKGIAGQAITFNRIKSTP